MKAVRFTKAETGFLRDQMDEVMNGSDRYPPHTVKTCGLARQVLSKLEAAESETSNVDSGALERALIAETSKIVPLGSPQGYARTSKMAAAAAATPEQATIIGRWVESQGWLHGPMTLEGVIRKWHDWYARAMASAPPEKLKPGLGAVSADTGQSARPTSPATPRRRPPGFGR